MPDPHITPTPARSIPSPFADPAFVARLKAADARRDRLQRAITRDVQHLGAITSVPASPSPAGPALPRFQPATQPILAYRVLVRVLALAADCLTECHSEAFEDSFVSMVERTERGDDRVGRLQEHVAFAVTTTMASDVTPALPTIWSALGETTLHDLVHRHWRTVVHAAAHCSTYNRWSDPHLVPRNLRRLRRLALSPAPTATAAA